jgi:hypothetical protein
LPLRLHHVLYVSVVGFMYWSICISLLGLLSGLIDNVKWFPGQLISFWLQSQCDFEEWDVHIFYIHHGNFSPQAEFDRCGLKIFNDRELCSPWNLLLEVLSVLP